jgi:hypothetical protein
MTPTTRRVALKFAMMGMASPLLIPAKAEEKSTSAANTPTADKPAGGTPVAKLIPGDPPMLDYGGGVKVPCNRNAFYTLWEGETFWLSFGFGISQSPETAMAAAAKQASGVMKFLLLTLAFAPERLVKVDGNGWRKKDPAAHDFVLGELELPPNPGKPMSDVFLGGGNIEISPFWNWGGMNNSINSMPGPTQSSQPVTQGPPSNMRQSYRHAFSSYIVMKKDLSLEDVRKRATVLQM